MKKNKKLTEAIKANDIEMLLELKKKGYDLSQINISAYIVDISIEVLRFLLENGVDVNANSDTGFISSLDEVIHMKNSKKLQLLLEYGAEISLFAYLDNIEALKFLFKNGVDINMKDQYNKTILEYAYEKLKIDVIKFLMKNNVDLNTQFTNDQNALTLSIVMGSNENTLKDITRDIAKKLDVDLKTAKKKVIAISSIEFIEKLLQNGSNVNWQIKNNLTVLMLAISMKRVDIVSLLLKYNADPNMSCKDETPLIESIRSKQLDITKLLLEYGADVNFQNKQGMAHFMYLIASGDFINVKLSIQYGVDIHIKDKNGNTPLIGASEFGYTKIVKLLIKNGADINAITNNGMTALSRAIAYNHFETVKLLLRKGANVKYTVDEVNLLILAVVTGASKRIIKLLLKNGININAKDKSGETALIHATKANRSKIVKYLINQGASIKDTNVLSIAAIKSNVELVKFLIKKGANTTKIDKNGNSVILQILSVYIIANKEILKKLNVTKSLKKYQKDIFKTIKLLLEAGADINVENKEGSTALIVAVLLNNLKMIRLFIQHSADVNYRNKEGHSALLMSLMPLEMINYMMKQSNQIRNLENKLGLPIDLENFYPKKYSLKIAKYLVEHGATLEKFNMWVIAISQQNLKMTKFIFDNSNNKDLPSYLHSLIILSSYGMQEILHNNTENIAYIELVGQMFKKELSTDFISKILELLVKAGININEKNEYGHTPLITAIIHNNTTMVKMLLDKGLDIEIKSKSGFRAIEYTVHNKTLRTLLIKNGARLNKRKTDKQALKKIQKEISRTIQKETNVDNMDWTEKNVLFLEGTLLSTALKNKKVKSLKKAIVSGANLDVINLIDLVQGGYSAKFIETVLKHSTINDQQDEKGRTALMYASKEGKIKIVKTLIQHNADTEILDNEGNDIWDYASLSGKEKIFYLLRNHEKNSAPNHEPKKLVKILANFTRDTPIKYTTHPWDFKNIHDTEHKNFKGFIAAIKRQWKKLETDLRMLSPDLHKKIYTFLLNTNKKADSWCEKSNISIGWSSFDELEKWCDEGNDPYKFKLKNSFIVENKEISTFEDVINLFKQEIENRKEHHMLKKHFISMGKYLGNDFQISFENFREEKFYTNVENLKLAISNIFSEIKKRNFHQIKVHAINDSEGQYIDIVIIQVGSLAQQSSNNMLKEVEKSGNFGSIKNLLTNLCDWSIESSFEKENYRVNYLRSNSYKSEIELLDYQPEGFTYKLRFYKA